MAQKSFIDILYEASRDLEKQRKPFEQPIEKGKISYESSFKTTTDRDDFKATCDEDGLEFSVDYGFKIKTKAQLDSLLLYLMSVRESLY